jgi:hypothetical protein
MVDFIFSTRMHFCRGQQKIVGLQNRDRGEHQITQVSFLDVKIFLKYILIESEENTYTP